MSYIANFSGVNPETIDENFNAYIALTLDETLTIELRTKALLSYLTEISALLASANAILADLKDIVYYEVDIIIQGWISDGTMSTIINNIITPIVNQINQLVTNNQSLNSQIDSVITLNNNNNQALIETVNQQATTLASLLSNYQAIQEVTNQVNDKHTTLSDTLNTALNTITLIQNRLTSVENNLGTLQDTVNTYQTRYNAITTTFIDDLNALQSRVTDAQNQLEVQIEAQTSNVTTVINLYNSLNQSLINLTGFADSARQFQQSIIQVINFIDQNQTTVNNNQTTVTNITNSLNTLLAFTFDFNSQFDLINQLRNLPTFSFNLIDTSYGSVIFKSMINGTATYRGMFSVNSTNFQSTVFTDSDFSLLPLTSLPNNILPITGWANTTNLNTIISRTYEAGITPSNNYVISSTAGIAGASGWPANHYINFSIYIPLSEVGS